MEAAPESWISVADLAREGIRAWIEGVWSASASSAILSLCFFCFLFWVWERGKYGERHLLSRLLMRGWKRSLGPRV